MDLVRQKGLLGKQGAGSSGGTPQERHESAV